MAQYSRTMLFVFAGLLVFFSIFWALSEDNGAKIVMSAFLLLQAAGSILLITKKVWKNYDYLDVMLIGTYALFGVVFLFGELPIGSFRLLPNHAFFAGMMLFFFGALEFFMESLHKGGS